MSSVSEYNPLVHLNLKDAFFETTDEIKKGANLSQKITKLKTETSYAWQKVAIVVGVIFLLAAVALTTYQLLRTAQVTAMSQSVRWIFTVGKYITLGIGAVTLVLAIAVICNKKRKVDREVHDIEIRESIYKEGVSAIEKTFGQHFNLLKHTKEEWEKILNNDQFKYEVHIPDQELIEEESKGEHKSKLVERPFIVRREANGNVNCTLETITVDQATLIAEYLELVGYKALEA